MDLEKERYAVDKDNWVMEDDRYVCRFFTDKEAREYAEFKNAQEKLMGSALDPCPARSALEEIDQLREQLVAAKRAFELANMAAGGLHLSYAEGNELNLLRKQMQEH